MGVKVKIVDLGMGDFLKEIKKLKKKPSVQVGVFADVKVRQTKGNIDNVGLMTIHEFGVPNNPFGSGKKAGRGNTVSITQRSIIRSATKENEKKGNEFILKEYDKMIKGLITFPKIFAKFGIFMENKFKLKFTDGTLEPNAPSTIKKKGSSRPLIDTGQLRQAIKSKVVFK